jgi:hypothetical protein
MSRKVLGYEPDPTYPGLRRDREFDLDANEDNQPTTTLNVGTAGSGVTAVEQGDGFHHKTVLTLDTVLPAIAGGAALGVGKLIYTLPAGAALVHASKMAVAITQTEGNIDADTPDVGIGTTIASGVVSVLGGTAAFENLVTGQTATNCTGTPTTIALQPTAGVDLFVAVGGDHTVYLNVADTWAASGDAAALLTGTVTLIWTFVG